MPDVDDRLRRDLPRLSEPVDVEEAFAGVQARRSRRRRVRRTEWLSLVVVVALVTASGAFALYRAFGSPSQPAREPVPSSSPSVVPSESASPAQVPSSAPAAAVPGYPAECAASQVVADFDGDGQFDTATIAKNHCFHHPGQEPIRTAPFNMALSWGGGAAGIVAMDRCADACVAYRAGDLNGDGASELWVIVEESSTAQALEVFELPQTEAFGEPASVVQPGAPGFAAGYPAVFRVLGTATHYATMRCAPVNGEVIAESADATGNEGEYRVRTTVLRFDRTDTRPFAQFTVVSTSDQVKHVPSGHPQDAFGRGQPCWAEPPSGG